MARTTTSRKDRFASALKQAGQTHARFAELHQVTYQHLYLVVRGRRRSPRLEAAVDAFIAAHPGRKVA